MYDGTALTDDGFTFTPNVLKTPDTLTAEITGEKTDVGTANNVVGKVKVMRGNVDATQNYTFGTHINGELKITTRPITLTSATNSWTYDGQAHYDTTITVGGEGWAGTDYATYSNFTTVTDYSDQPVKNTFTYTEGTGTKFSNYDFTIINGDLSISKITTQIIVTAGSDTKPYDGTDLTCDTFTYTEGVLVTGDRIDATTLGSIKNVGTAKNEVTEVKVFRGEDDITANYTFGTHVDGALEVIPRAVTISSKEGKLEYNAQAQSYEEVEVVEGSFVTGEGLVYSRFATATDYSAEGIDNTFSYAAQEGTTLTNYNITVQYNKLYITKVATPIVVTAASDEKTYDGDALTNSEFTFTSGVLKGNDKLQATIEGSITNVGTANNNVTAVKIMRDTTDATTNYTFGSHVAGALEITQRDITLLSEGQT